MSSSQCFFCLFPLSRCDWLHLSVSFVCFIIHPFLHLTSSLGVWVGRDGERVVVNPTLHQTVNRRSASLYINSHPTFKSNLKTFLCPRCYFPLVQWVRIDRGGGWWVVGVLGLYVSRCLFLPPSLLCTVQSVVRAHVSVCHHMSICVCLFLPSISVRVQ